MAAAIPRGATSFKSSKSNPVASGPDGSLFRTRVRTFRASYQGRATQNDEGGYVYCSTARPAIISSPLNQLPVAVFLAPDEQSPAYVQRSSANFYTLYFSLCHNLDAGRAAAKDRRGVARSFGYQVGLGQPRTVTLNRVEDILKPR